MSLASKNTMLVAALAAAVAAAGCGSGKGGSSSLASSAATSTASVTSGGPAAITTYVNPAPVATSTTTATAQITSGHGVVDVRSASVWIVRDGDYAEFQVLNSQVLTAAGVKDGRTLLYRAEISPTASNSVALQTFTADEADLHGRIVLWPPILPGQPPPPRQVAFQTDGGDVYMLDGALGAQAIGTPGAITWRGLRVTGQVTLAPSLNVAGKLDVSSFAFDRVIQVSVLPTSLFGTRSALCLDMGERWGTYVKSFVRYPWRPIERRAGAIARSDLRTLDEKIAAADLFHKLDFYGLPFGGLPATQVSWLTIDKTKTITIRGAAALPADLADLLKEIEAIRLTLPVI